MDAKLLLDDRGQRTYMLVFAIGDEVVSELTDFARKEKLAGSHFMAIGAFREATLGFFNLEKKDYKKIPVSEQVEVVSLLGDIALQEDGSPKIHAHAVLSRADGSTIAGHLINGQVRPTLEMTVVETPTALRRRHDAAIGLGLIRLG